MDNLIKQIKKARFIWICGNGGSAATAEHFATDLVKKGYRAIALSSNTSVMTMIANDYGFENVFSKQLEVLGNNEDLLITISCSGTSPNVEKARKIAFVEIGMGFYQFETFKEGDRDFGKLEDKHLAFAHEIARQL